MSGLNDAIAISSGEEEYKSIRECSIGKSSAQLTAIFKKWLNANPERWDEPAAGLYIEALEEACSK